MQLPHQGWTRIFQCVLSLTLILKETMDGLFRRLQEVTDLTNASATEGATSSDATRTVGEDSGLPGSDASREELVEALKTLTRDLGIARSSIKAIKEEAKVQQDEFSAYKQKVTSWREQMKAARAQDRKTIDALREAQSAAKGVDGAAKAAGESDAYVASLEEQVKVLKETVRDHAD